jgi:hypothetical protein
VPTEGTEILKVIIGPLVHSALKGIIESWHYGQYGAPEPYHLRLRILWRSQEVALQGKDAMQDFLRRAQLAGSIIDHFEGSHGERDSTYPGEFEEYKDTWKAVYKLWEAQSELALSALCRSSEETPTLPHQWERGAHLLANRLFLNYPDEVYLALGYACGYLDLITGRSRAQPVLALAQFQRDMGTSLRPHFAESVGRKFSRDTGE